MKTRTLCTFVGGPANGHQEYLYWVRPGLHVRIAQVDQNFRLVWHEYQMGQRLDKVIYKGVEQ